MGIELIRAENPCMTDGILNPQPSETPQPSDLPAFWSAVTQVPVMLIIFVASFWDVEQSTKLALHHTSLEMDNAAYVAYLTEQKMMSLYGLKLRAPKTPANSQYLN